MAGSLAWGPLADKWGRRPITLIGLLVIAVCGVCSAFASNLIMLLFFQFFVGVGVGSMAIPFDLFAELLPSQSRGTFLVYLQSFFSIGATFVVAMAWLVLPSWGWRQLVLFTTLPVLVSLVLSFFYLPESPRWLLCQGRGTEARQVLIEAVQVNGSQSEKLSRLIDTISIAADISIETLCRSDSDDPISSSNSNSNGNNRSVIEIVKQLFDNENIWLTIPLWATWFCFGLGYYGVVILVVRIYSENTLAVGEPVCAFNYGAILANSASELISIVILFLVIDYGRIKTVCGFFLVAAISVAFTGADWISENLLFYFLLVARISATGANAATWVATSELLPTALRATGHGFATACLRLGALVAPFLVDSADISLLTIGLLLCFVFSVGLGCAMMLPETTGKELDMVW
jgi:hypothetical protein